MDQWFSLGVTQFWNLSGCVGVFGSHVLEWGGQAVEGAVWTWAKAQPCPLSSTGAWVVSDFLQVSLPNKFESYFVKLISEILRLCLTVACMRYYMKAEAYLR